MAHTGVGGDRANEAEIPNGPGRRTCLRHLYRQVLLMSLIQVIPEQFIQRPSLQSASRGGGGGEGCGSDRAVHPACCHQGADDQGHFFGVKNPVSDLPEQVSLSLVSAHLFQGCHRATLAQAP